MKVHATIDISNCINKSDIVRKIKKEAVEVFSSNASIVSVKISKTNLDKLLQNNQHIILKNIT